MNRSIALVFAVTASCAALTGSCNLNPQPFPPSGSSPTSNIGGGGAQDASQNAASSLDAAASDAARAADALQDAAPADASGSIEASSDAPTADAPSDAANEPDTPGDGALDVATEGSE